MNSKLSRSDEDITSVARGACTQLLPMEPIDSKNYRVLFLHKINQLTMFYENWIKITLENVLQ